MRLNLLGPVELLGGDGLPAQIGPGKRRAVLAVLALEANQVVEVGRILDLCWDGAPPPHARTALQGHISALRRLLDEDLRLLTRDSGYALHAAPGAVDAVEFRDLVREAAGLDPAAALGPLSRALELWRGPALADLAGHGLRGTLAQGLQHARRDALVSLARIRLELGLGAETVAPLRRAVAENPLDEPLASALIRSLHQAGARAEALRAYDTARRTLASQLGVNPGPALRDAHQAVLRGDAARAPAPPAVPGGSAAPARARRNLDGLAHWPDAPRTAASVRGDEAIAALARGRDDASAQAEPAHPAPDLAAVLPAPAQLPRHPAGFTGRRRELRRLEEGLAESGLALICGPAGVGKTSIALEWAHANAHRFPDGQLFVALRGVDPAGRLSPAAALGGLLQALGLPKRSIPAGLEERSALYRSRLAGRRILILLDDAGDLDQIRPLLPGEPQARTVVTSRHRLDGLVARDGAAVLGLAPLCADEAEQLLTRLLGRDRAEAEPAALAQLAELCDRLPLALRVAAARLAMRPEWSLGEVVEELADEQVRLAALETGDADLGITSALELSHHALPRSAAALLTLLGVHPGNEVGATAAAALLASDVPAARTTLGALARSSLLQPLGKDAYTRHDLVRLYGRDLAGRLEPRERERASARLFDYFLEASRCAGGVAAGAASGASSVAMLFDGHRSRERPAPEVPAFPHAESATAWFLAEEPAMRTLVLETAAQRREVLYDRAWRLADNLGNLYDRLRPDADRDACMKAGLVAARGCGNRSALFQMLIRNSHTASRRGDFEAARAVLRESAGLFGADPAGMDTIDRCRLLIECAACESRAGDWDAATQRYLAVLELGREFGDAEHERALLNEVALSLVREGGAEGAVGDALAHLGRLEQGGSELSAALELARAHAMEAEAVSAEGSVRQLTAS